MDKEKNILLAKKYMVESIYRSANIEGVGVTFPETQTICDGMSVANHTVDEINTVNDLKNAWRWIFQNIDNDIDIETLCTISRIAGKYTAINAGSLRDENDEPIRVTLGNNDYYYPEIPKRKAVVDRLSELEKEKSLAYALDMFCYICKLQAFNDGNKRTATLITNMYMIQNGFGILSIPVERKTEFYDVLTSYYRDDSNKKNLTDFLQEYCITGNGKA